MGASWHATRGANPSLRRMASDQSKRSVENARILIFILCIPHHVDIQYHIAHCRAILCYISLYAHVDVISRSSCRTRNCHCKAKAVTITCNGQETIPPSFLSVSV